MRTLVLNLRLGERFQGGGNDFPQSPFLTLDRSCGHGRERGVFWLEVWIGKPTKNLSFPLINLGICYFGKRKEPNARRPAQLKLLSLSSPLSFSFRRWDGEQ